MYIWLTAGYANFWVEIYVGVLMLTDQRPCNLLQDFEDVRHTAQLGLFEPFAIARYGSFFLGRCIVLLLPLIQTAAASGLSGFGIHAIVDCLTAQMVRTA